MPSDNRSQRLQRLLHPALLGRFGRATPLSERWGYDRGLPIDRYYIEHFLARHRADIRGDVLEVKSADYAQRFGQGVRRIEVLDIDGANENATIVADIAASKSIAHATFDCFVLTQTLQYVYDLRGAVHHAHRILRSGGVLLATVPSVSRVPIESPELHDYWRFTEASCRALFAEAFGDAQTTVGSYGNVVAAQAFLSGLATEDLTHARLERHDRRFPVIVAVRAVKA